jgi:hypothetical protein
LIHFYKRVNLLGCVTKIVNQNGDNCQNNDD